MGKHLRLVVSKWYKTNLLVTPLCLILVLLTGCVHSLDNEDLVSNFIANEASFVQLRDLIQEEEQLVSIGYDNVGSFWLSGDEWINHQPPYKRYTQQEMLESEGLSLARYKQYLDLLDLVDGYRVSKDLSEGRIVIHISKSGMVSSGTALNIVYYSSTPVFLSSAKYLEISDGWYVEHIGD